MNDIWINIGLYLTYALIAICVLGILFFAISRIAGEPAQAKSALLGIGALIVVSIVAYLLSTGEDANGIYARLNVSETISHRVGTGLISLYIIMGLTILSILYVELTRLFK